MTKVVVNDGMEWVEVWCWGVKEGSFGMGGCDIRV